MTLKGQIISATVGLAIAVAGAIAYVTGDIVADQIRDRIGANLSDLAAEMSGRLDRELAVRVAEVDVLASLPFFEQFSDKTTMRSVIENLQSALPEFSWVGVLDDRGRVVVGTGALLEGMDISHRPVFREGIVDRYIGNVHDAALLGSLIEDPSGAPTRFIDIAQPIRSGSGAPAGVLAAHLSWAWVRSVERALLGDGLRRKDVQLYVVSGDGTVLLGPDYRQHGNALDLDAVRLAAAGGAGWLVEDWNDGDAYLTGYARTEGHETFPGFGWVVLARQPVAAAFRPIRDLTWRIAAIGFVFAGFAAGLGWYVASRIAGPVKSLSRAALALQADQSVGFPRIRGPREIEVLSETFEDLIETLIAKQNALDAVMDQAFTDPLTELGNRGALDRFLSSRQDSSLSYAVLAVDLDGFKHVNDTYGHAAGDRVLQEVAERLRRCVRAGDVLVRHGGDEFLVFLAMLDPARDGPARRIAQRVVQRIAEPMALEETAAAGPDGLRVGASVGVAFYPRHGATLEHVIKLADDALYAAKAGGKGRVAVHNPRKAAKA